MKNLELCHYGVQEMNAIELRDVNGGDIDIPHWLAAVIAGAIVVVGIILVIL